MEEKKCMGLNAEPMICKYLKPLILACTSDNIYQEGFMDNLYKTGFNEAIMAPLQSSTVKEIIIPMME
jgi:hypothetical protein